MVKAFMTAFFVVVTDFAFLCGSYRMLKKSTMMLGCFGILSLSGCSEPEMILPGERIAITQQIELLPLL